MEHSRPRIDRCTLRRSHRHRRVHFGRRCSVGVILLQGRHELLILRLLRVGSGDLVLSLVESCYLLRISGRRLRLQRASRERLLGVVKALYVADPPMRSMAPSAVTTMYPLLMFAAMKGWRAGTVGCRGLGRHLFTRPWLAVEVHPCLADSHVAVLEQLRNGVQARWRSRS